jgi:hypothetical protein
VPIGVVDGQAKNYKSVDENSHYGVTGTDALIVG